MVKRHYVVWSVPKPQRYDSLHFLKNFLFQCVITASNVFFQSVLRSLMAQNVQRTVNVKKQRVRNVTLSLEIVTVRQDGPVIPVHRTWTSVRREPERVTEVYIRSVSTTRAHLTANVFMEETISQAVFVCTSFSTFK